MLGDEKTMKNNRKVAKKIRKSEYYQSMDKLPVFLSSYYPSPETHPILFLDIYSKLPEEKIT